MTARRARQIRRRSRERSARLDHMGVSELFGASPMDRAVMHEARDPRLLLWLLGFTSIPPASNGGSPALRSSIDARAA